MGDLSNCNCWAESWEGCEDGEEGSRDWPDPSRGDHKGPKVDHTGTFFLIYIWNFHVLNHFLLIYVCKLHWNFNTMFVCQVIYRIPSNKNKCMLPRFYYTSSNNIYQAIFRRWLPLADALLRMVIRCVPEPSVAQKKRIHTLYPSLPPAGVVCWQHMQYPLTLS